MMEMPEGWKSLKATHIWEPDFANDEVEMALDLMKEMAEALNRIGEKDYSQSAAALKAHIANTVLQKFLEWK